MSAAALRVAGARSPEREALSGLVERLTQLIGDQERLAQARAKVEEDVLAAYGEIRTAEAALTEAKQNEGQRVLAEALGDAVGPSPVAAATRELADDQEKLEAARRRRESLKGPADEIQKQIAFVRYKLDDAVAAALKGDPAVERLRAEYREASQRVAELSACLGAIRKAGGLTREDNFAPRLDHEKVDAAGAAWTAAIAALTSNPDAELPAVGAFAC
ncbi:MAG TPA: hypothetical protein VKZ79_00610 [Alphaproteobacteria bacterium]|nr:hypothetical protein [Alphaproteobacteria bacterium]